MVACSLDNVTPHVQSALFLVTLPLFRQLDLLGAQVRVSDVCQKLGVSRSAAYALAGPVLEAARNVQRPCGRPATPPASSPDQSPQKVATETVRFLMNNPGSVVPGKRRIYTDAFRRFVVGLVRPGGSAEMLSTAELARAIDVAPRTLRDWLPQRTTKAPPAESVTPIEWPVEPTGTVETEPSKTTTDGTEPGQTQKDEQRLPAEIVQLLELWQRWRGGFSAFATSLHLHRLYLKASDLRQILEDYADRTPTRRGHKQNDAEASRGSLETFYPNAQLFADGKEVNVTLNNQRFTFCWLALVDALTTTPTGFSIRETEDSVGLLEALEHSKCTTGAAPDALTRDGKPSLHTPFVEATLHNDDILAVPATPNRGQSKAPVEGLFGLFSQYLPPIELFANSTKQLAKQILYHVLFAYCVGRGRAPRQTLGGHSPKQAFLQDLTTDEQRQNARRRLREIRNRILDQQADLRRRTDPTCRQRLQETFDELGLSDPKGTIIPTIARYGIDAVIEAIAIFQHKHSTGRLPKDHRERYLLGITRNVAERNEDLAVYRETVRLRLKARDSLLQPLQKQAKTLADTRNLHDYIDACLHRALDARFQIDRQFWADACFTAFETLPQHQRRRRGPIMARQIATQFRLDRRHRDRLLAALATATTQTLAA